MTAVQPVLKSEIDWLGYPSAGYYDQLRYADGLVSYYRMANAASLIDALAANNGVTVGTPSLVTGALPYDTDQGMSFNGSSQRAYVPSSSSLTPTNMTVQGWVKLPSLPAGTRDLVAKRGTWAIQVSSAGIVTFTVKNDTASVTVSAYAALATNTYYHLTAVHDSTNGMVYLYVDGVLDQSSVWAGGREGNSRPIYFAANPSGTAPTYQSTQSATGTASATLTCNAPASIASGDLMIAQLQMHNGTGTITAEPTGWFLLGYAIDPGNHWTRIYYKIASGSEPASYTWTNSAGDNWVMAISRFTGVDSIQAFANPTYGGATASSTTHSTGTHLPSVDNNMIVALFAQRGGTSFTEDSGTERYDLQAPGPTQTIAMCTQTQATAASINVTGTTLSGSVGSAFMVILAGSGINTHTTVTEDEWSFWNIALTAEQIAEQFQARLGGVGSWSDVTADTAEVTTKSGRLAELDRITAGTSNCQLDDLTRPYDAANTSSPNAPNVLPVRRIRHRADLSSVLYPLCRHFIERLPSTYEGDYESVNITASDGFEQLNLAGVSGTLAAALSGTQIGKLLDKAGWPTADRAIDAGQFTIDALTLSSAAKALTEIQTIADSEFGIFFIDAAGVATFHDYAHRWTNSRSITSQATFSNAVDANPDYSILLPSFDRDRIINDWTVTTSDGTARQAIDALSISRYFRRTQIRSTRLLYPSDAQTVATALLQATASPAWRIPSLTIQPIDATTWQKVLGLAISDRITVIRAPAAAAGGSTITKDFFVEGISWRIPPVNSTELWSVAFQLSPCSPGSYYDTITREYPPPVSYYRMDAVA